MAMLIDGVWSQIDKIIVNGEFVRQTSVHNNSISKKVISAIAQQPGRFHLIASWTCPWSHRAIIIRQQKGLAHFIPLHMTGGKRLQGYPANYGNPWQIPGTNKEIIHLHQLYSLSNALHTGRPTVPVLWDSQTQQIISDESAQIMRAFDAVILPAKVSPLPFDYTLVPAEQIDEIENINQDIYQNLSNATYQAGFAENQLAYENAVNKVFNQLDLLENKLSEQRFLLGAIISEADWRLFATLVRFDIDYFPHSRCSIRRLVDYHNLWAYARDLYSVLGIAETINFNAIHLSNYNEDQIIPRMPKIDWLESHGRDRLGAVQVKTRANKVIKLTFEKNQ